MSKVIGVSLLILGASSVAYPFFLKKEKKLLTTDEFLFSESNANYCENISLKLNMLISDNDDIRNKINEIRRNNLLRLISDEEGSKKINDYEKQSIKNADEIKSVLEKKDNIKCSIQTKDCIENDKTIKRLKDIISESTKELLKPISQRKNKAPDNYLKKLINKSNETLFKAENRFVENNCRADIENLRLDESGYILTKKSEQSEKNVIPSNEKEQYIYIGLGSFVLLTGLYVILKK
jgi:hypothetical protein